MNKNLIVVFFIIAIALLYRPATAMAAGNSKADTLIADGKDEYPVYDYMSYYGDTAELSFKTIIHGADSGYFTPMGGKPLNIGFTNNYYWTRMNIRNRSAKPAKLMWLFMNSAINRVELIKAEGDSVESLGKSGDSYPFKHRPVYFNLVAYFIDLQPGEGATFYTFMDKHGENFKAGFRLADVNTFTHFAYLEYFVVGILIGILLLIMFFNIFLLFSLKDEVHGWYAIYVLIAILMLLAFEGMDFQMLYPNIPWFCDLSRLTTCGFNLFFMLMVMRKFYQLDRYNSLFHYAVLFMQWFTFLFTMADIPVYKVFPSLELKRIYITVFSIMAIATMALVTVTSVEKVKQGFKPAYFYLFALSFLFLGAIEYLLNLFGWITTFIDTLNRIEVGVVMETVVISFGILYRYNLFKREKEKLAAELENSKAQTTLHFIATQEAERKRIAEDLHDDLGGNLASLKLNIQNLDVEPNRLQPIIQLLDKASEDVRSISHNLMPPEFSNTSLKDLLLNQYNLLNTQGNVHFNFHISGAGGWFSKMDELMIYRIVSELTTNILKHSQATEATIQLIYYDNYLEIMAEDNGKGITPQTSDGIGLKNIQSRVDYLGGKVNIHSNGFGTTVIVIVYYKK